ncbi:MAG: hypothetical protein WCH40_05785 [Verrucomicrobiales bacterium]
MMPQDRMIIRDTGIGAGNEFFAAQGTAFAASRPRWVSVQALVRPVYWTKNVLLFVPLLLSSDVTHPDLWLKALAGFLAVHWALPIAAALAGFALAISWWLARRRKPIDDPLLFAATDPTSLLIAALVVILAVISLAPSTPA